MKKKRLWKIKTVSKDSEKETVIWWESKIMAIAYIKDSMKYLENKTDIICTIEYTREA